MSTEQTQKISLLINAIYFFIECAFIMETQPQDYRLVVIHHGRVISDANYQTLRGARIAFSRMFQDKAWEYGIKPQWSHFYDPDQNWLLGKTRLAEMNTAL